MRKVLGALGCAMLIALASGVARAADKGGQLPAQGTATEIEIPKWQRSGAYVGLALGYTAQQMQTDSFHFGDAGMIGGAFVGYNYNLGGAVVGVEADYLLTGISSSTSVAGVSMSASNHFLASIRARAGLPIGPALLYATAGPAFTERKASVQTGPWVSESKDLLVGVALGAGIEAELTRTLMVRIEALHYSFPDQDVNGAAGAWTSKDQQTTVRMGLGFKLN